MGSLVYLLVFAWKMNPGVTLFGFVSGLPLVGLGSLTVQTSIVGGAVAVFLLVYLLLALLKPEWFA